VCARRLQLGGVGGGECMSTLVRGPECRSLCSARVESEGGGPPTVAGSSYSMHRVGRNRMWQAQTTVLPVENDHIHYVNTGLYDV